MDKTILVQWVALALVLSMSVGCSGSSGGGSGGNGTGGTGGAGAGATRVETVGSDVADVTDGVGDTVIALGDTVSQVDLPLVGAVTDGSGDVITHPGEGVNSLSSGLSDGLGSLNDNAIGTIPAGVSGTVSESGEAVSALGTTTEALNTLPVFAQLDESTGLLTDLGGTVDMLGAVLTQTGDMLTITFTQEDGIVSGLTTKLTAVVRPLVVNLDGTTQVMGEALVVGPVASNLLEQVGTAVVVLGNDISVDDNAVLASLGGTVDGLLAADGGGLIDGGDSGNDGLVDQTDDTLLDPLLSGIL